MCTDSGNESSDASCGKDAEQPAVAAALEPFVICERDESDDFGTDDFGNYEHVFDTEWNELTRGTKKVRKRRSKRQSQISAEPLPHAVEQPPLDILPSAQPCQDRPQSDPADTGGTASDPCGGGAFVDAVSVRADAPAFFPGSQFHGGQQFVPVALCYEDLSRIESKLDSLFVALASGPYAAVSSALTSGVDEKRPAFETCLPH